MRKTVFTISVVLLLFAFSGLVFASDMRNVESNICSEEQFSITSNPVIHQITQQGKAMWDILFSFETTSSSQSGIATDGNFIYTSSFSSPLFRKFEMDGTFVEEFSITGVSTANCMTYDGTHFYGAKGQLSAGIFVLDLENHTLLNTIPISAPSIVGVGHISYDPQLDSGNGGFWVGYWHELCAVDMSGNQIIANVTGNHHCAGTAYDNVSDPANPCLYLFQQAGTTSLEIRKFDINSQTYSGVLHVATDIPGTSTNPIASGMNSYINPDGKLVLIGMIDHFPQNERAFGYEIASASSYTKDIGMHSLVSPQTGNNLTASEDVTVEMFNNGTTAVSGFQIQYTINDGTSTVGPFSQTVTQTIAPGAKENFTFTEKADLSSAQTSYTITVTSSLSGDENSNNDVLVKVVNNTSGTYPTASGGGPEHISNLQIAGISNPTGCDYYTDYTSDPSLYISLEIGVPAPLTMSIGRGYNADNGAIWIDWNRDFDFSSNERVFLSSFGQGPYSTSITAPDSAQTGTNLRMRLRLDYNNVDPQPYGTRSFGEVEDYTVYVGNQSTSNPVMEETSGAAYMSVSPNPSKGSASVVFGVPGDEAAKIRIYDLNGRIIQTVYEGEVSAQQNSLELDLNRLPSGVYLVRLESPSFEVSKRVMLID
jgi:hypothetical protein